MKKRIEVTKFTSYGFGITFDSEVIALCFLCYRIDFYYKMSSRKTTKASKVKSIDLDSFDKYKSSVDLNNRENLFKALHDKYPPFEVSGWIPPTQRNRKTKDGWQYRNIQYNKQTKTFWYELKSPNGRWSGPYHGRTINDFLKLKEIT